MHPSSLRWLAVFGFVTACSDDGGTVEPGPKNLTIQLTATHLHELDGATFTGTWELAGKVAFDTGEAVGWVAITNLTAEDQPHRDLPCTRAVALPADGPL